MQTPWKDIPDAPIWSVVQKITEGWSNDDKYYVKTNEGKEFLLRLSDEANLKREQALYAALRTLGRQNIRAAKLVDEGSCNQGKRTYRLFNWIRGSVFKEQIKQFSPEEQYQYGLQAGIILGKIHQVPCPPDQISWAKHYNQKIDTKIKNYQSCGITFPQDQVLLDCIKENRVLLAQRPQCFQHGDFHVGNMLLTPDLQLAIIDFNRLDFGDPWEEFNRISWSAMESPYFASGQINGYFKNEVPDHFFQLMALYISVNQIGAIPWAIPNGTREVSVILKQTKAILSWYEDFRQIIPNWYRPDKF